MATQLFQPPYGSPSWFHVMVGEAATEPTMRVVDMGPALAKEMLAQNDNNRSVRASKMAQYAADMAAGRWTLNGEPIIISREGKLNDGQHRCLAAIEANATVPVVVMFGIDRDTRLTVDQGGARSAGDYLGMEGVANASLSAAVGRMVIAFERDDGRSMKERNRVTSAEIRARVAKDTALAEAVTFGHTNGIYSKAFAAGSLIGFAYYELARVNRDAARAFLEKVCRGDGLKVGDPAHTLREKLIGGKRTQDRKLAMIFKAWNFYRRGMKVRVNSLNEQLPFPALI